MEGIVRAPLVAARLGNLVLWYSTHDYNLSFLNKNSLTPQAVYRLATKNKRLSAATQNYSPICQVKSSKILP
jgi:hypothetical protein